MQQLRLLLVFLLGAPLYVCGQHVISGRILSAADSSQLEGVSISVMDTVRAITDRQGRFKFSYASPSPELRISLLGYTPLTIAGQTGDITYYLAPQDNLLEEVMVNTGYQRLPKERLTGSFEFIDSALFHRQVSTDVISRLDG